MPFHLSSAAPALLAGMLAATAYAGTPGLDEALDRVAPGVQKWATVCVISGDEDAPIFTWHDYRDSGSATDFWPASTIKLYTVIAALELLNERGFPFDSTTVTFEHGNADGTWTLDCARGVREMLGEIFRRSSNEDYTLLLRLVGLDRLNTRFLTPERGFPHSALMRGYVTGRPYGYATSEPQRLTLRALDGRTETFSHTWSGRYYAEERGGAVFDARTGNLTSPRELAECLRRILFHEHLPEAERYRLTSAQLEFLRHGGGGLCGLETKDDDSAPIAWKSGIEAVFPSARFFHKCGLISNYALEAACVDDRAQHGPRFLLVPVVHAGSDTQPENGEKLIAQMARAISEWVKAQ